MESQMTDEQMKELAELRVAIQDLKYQLIPVSYTHLTLPTNREV